MLKPFKIILLSIAGVVGLLILISAALFFLVDASVFKPRVETAASEALGMEVRIGGPLEITFFPELQIQLGDVRIRNRGMEIVSAKKAYVEVALRPLFHGEIRIGGIGMQHPRISIQRDRNGVLNYKNREAPKRRVSILGLRNLSLTDGILLYRDEKSGEGFEAGSFNLDVHSLRIAGGNGAERLKNLSFIAEFSCREIRTKSLILSDVKFTGKGRDGVFALDPVTLRLFGGQGSGKVEADFSDPAPRYSVHASLSKFRIEEYLKTVSAEKLAEGSMNFSTSLSMQGNTAKEIVRSAGGSASLRGENLILHGYDLDREFARFESSQNFNLVDAAAFFFAGPIGLAVTKGYDFAGIFQGSGGSSRIGKLFSDWKVERGIAQALDVAMATRQNRVALKGRINFVDERFDDVTIALINARGCARVQQKIHGPFRKPVVEKPNVLISLAGPVLNLLRQAGELLGAEKCEAFYTGSVPAPR